MGLARMISRFLRNKAISHDGSMVLVYMLTKRGYIDGIHVTIYSSTMDPIGMDKYPQKYYWQKFWIIFTDLKQGFFLGGFPLDPFTHHR